MDCIFGYLWAGATWEIGVTETSQRLVWNRRLWRHRRCTAGRQALRLCNRDAHRDELHRNIGNSTSLPDKPFLREERIGHAEVLREDLFMVLHKMIDLMRDF